MKLNKGVHIYLLYSSLSEDVYFNSGVMRMDLAALREYLPFSMIQEFIEENREQLVYFDQDILNRLLLSLKKVFFEVENEMKACLAR